MPRQSRIVIPNCPHHIIQRGHNRQVVFTCEADYLYYLDNLQEWKTTLNCKVYAYCLMINHVHLVVDPGEQSENLALLMKRIGGKQARYINKLEKRTGSLWEGRYKSSPIQSDRYLLACCRYVELNPLRAGISKNPSDYLWSSCGAKTGLRKQPWLELDHYYLEIDDNRELREKKYQDWLLEDVLEEELTTIRNADQRGQLTGKERFVQEISEKIGRRIEIRGQGRPKNIK